MTQTNVEHQDISGIELQAAFRRDLLDSLRLELLGPSEPTEELYERPTLRYLMGRLAPAGTEVSAEEDEGDADTASDSDESDGGPSAPTVLAMNPSSIGLSVVVAEGVGQLEIVARWGQYQEEQEGQSAADGGDGGEGPKSGGRKRSRRVYRREPVEHTLTVDLSGPKHHPLDLGIAIEHEVRLIDDGRRAVSVFLVNRREASDPIRPPDPEWIFQPELELSGVDGAEVFGPRVLIEGAMGEDPDLRSAELVYWSQPEYAVGHGCAVDWDPPTARQPIQRVRTSMLPAYELPRVDPREDAPGVLDMRQLGGDGPDGVHGDELGRMLRPLASAYTAWIGELETGLLEKLKKEIDQQLKDTAWDHLERARIAAERIEEGIQLLERDELVRRAFCFANRAMALQRERSVISLARRRGQREPWPAQVRTQWRPFQMAFILLNLPSVAVRDHRDRTIADLLWFPTGGGKTEAYLGLTAFTLAYRRIRPPIDGYRSDVGVAVLMRYTLRLLTLQQFQRATTLICACDRLRRDEGPEWGGQPFSIGLWVGQSATPNTYSDPQWELGAKEALSRLGNGARVKAGSPVQLVSCPWCGAKLDHTNYRADDDYERVLATCSNDDCEYAPTGPSRGLPIHIVDDEVYRHVPSLVIATVDKFARMPWKGQIQALFGRVERHCPRHGFLSAAESNHANSHRASASTPAVQVATTAPLEPPDLIIQDELHLISGPLGTLVGIYETAIDLLSSARVDGKLLPPKVIASTATIRRADSQVSALFQRNVQIFPPQGLDSRDSWFGKEVAVTPSDPGRLYVGVYAPGKSVKTALVRVYAGLLSRARALADQYADSADPFMTLVGYFNSLRELGGALRLVEDDIPGRIGVLNRRDGGRWARRILFERQELTSNKKAEEVPEVLAKLERPFTDEKPESGKYPVDTVLASNMISVGVDIDRLGLMVVNGQPKTTAEYIQATSRVGRGVPGIVLTVYNWTRPRDISHYERFRSYHQMLYRFVEPTSVTPFSSRARDRALDGVFAGLVRLGDTSLTREEGADAYAPTNPWVTEVVNLIAARAEGVAGGDGTLAETTRQELMSRSDVWAKAANDWDLRYTRRGLGPRPPDDRRYLLGSAEEDDDGFFAAPGSLREVEGEVHVYLPSEATRS
jgi:hypothetical protein